MQPTRPFIPLKIDIVVHGRFHGFSLAKALLNRGHDVILHTNYPSSIVARWGIPRRSVRSLVPHAIGTRVIRRIGGGSLSRMAERFFHPWFGRWAARSVRNDADLVYGFSGVMEELLGSPLKGVKPQLRMVVRGSAHIRVQARLLKEEELRVGARLDRSAAWMIAREEREYALAPRTIVLSRFAYDSFVESGFPKSRLLINPLGVDTTVFRTSRDAVIERERRILGGEPLRVLYVGSFSFQKGAHDFVKMALRMHPRMSFCVVGDFPPETVKLCREVGDRILFQARVAEQDLVGYYNQADLFVFPSIQDGFGAVLLQAAASGLPILATTNCSAPDFVVEGQTGWILPARDAEAFIRRLSWCHENRSALAQMVGQVAQYPRSRSWTDCADDLIEDYFKIMSGLQRE